MTCWAAVAVTGLLLGLLGWRTARPPLAPLPDRDGYFTRWAALHGGYDPRTGNPWLRGWLTAVHVLAGPLARRGVQPDVVTVGSAWLAGVVLVLADLGGHWPIAAGLVLVASALLDNVDGCVAVLQDRTTRWGYVLDSVVDRVTDSAYLVAAVLVGCPGWVAVAAGFAVFLLEYLRARAGNAGGDGVGRITMAERPTRVILLSAAVLFSGVFPVWAPTLSALGPVVLLAMTCVAFVQLAVVVRRQLV